MLELGKVLVVDPSPVVRKLTATLLGSRASKVLTATGRKDATSQLDAELGLIISEVALEDGSGFDLLSEIAEWPGRRPALLLTTAHPSQQEAQLATLRGAIGYLSKPFSASQLFRTLVPQAERGGEARAYGSSAAIVQVRDPERDATPALHWEARDLSERGCFVELGAPLAVGTELNINLLIDGAALLTAARVVRVQEPCWGQVGGVALVFEGLSEADRLEVGEFIERRSKPS